MMKATIEDACFSAGAKIRIDRDTGELGAACAPPPVIKAPPPSCRNG